MEKDVEELRRSHSRSRVPARAARAGSGDWSGGGSRTVAVSALGAGAEERRPRPAEAEGIPRRPSRGSSYDLRRIVSYVSSHSPFIPTGEGNAGMRAARTVAAVGGAVLELVFDESGCTDRRVSHFQREAVTEWDRAGGNMSETLPATSCLCMWGTMALGMSLTDWPPPPANTGRSPIQFLWIHYPAAKGPHYAELAVTGWTRLFDPVEDTLRRLQHDMSVQIGFTMDVMLQAAVRGGRVAMVFNSVGAGAFVARLSGEQQVLCLARIMEALLGELVKRLDLPCDLFVTGSAPPWRPGMLVWRNRLGFDAMVSIPPEAADRVYVGDFDCLTMAQELANSGHFENVGLTMAADRHRIGNGYLSVRYGWNSGVLEFGARNASDENNSRRSSLLPDILFINYPTFDWHMHDPRAVLEMVDIAERYLATPSDDLYHAMMTRFGWQRRHGILWAAHRSIRLTVPQIAQMYPNKISQHSMRRRPLRCGASLPPSPSLLPSRGL